MIVKANGDVDVIDRVIMKHINDFHLLTPTQKTQAVYNLSKDDRHSIDAETFNEMFNKSCSNHIEALHQLSNFNKSQQKRYFTNLLNYKGVGRNQLWLEAFNQTRRNISNIETLYDLALENFYIEQQDFFTTTGHILNEEFYINLGYFKGLINIENTPISISCHMMDEYIDSAITDTVMGELDKLSFFTRELKLSKRKALTKTLAPIRRENKIDHFDDQFKEVSILTFKDEIIILFRNANSLKNISIDNFYNDCIKLNKNTNIQQYIDDNIKFYTDKLNEIVT